MAGFSITGFISDLLRSDNIKNSVRAFGPTAGLVGIGLSVAGPAVADLLNDEDRNKPNKATANVTSV